MPFACGRMSGCNSFGVNQILRKMSNVKISERGWEILRNGPLADAILLALLTWDYSDNDEGIIVKHEGQEFTVYTESQLSTMEIKKERNNK